MNLTKYLPGLEVPRKMRECFGDGTEYQRSYILNSSISHKEKLNQGQTGKTEQGQESNLDPHSQARAPSMASPCLSGGVKLRRELDSDSQRHSVSYHSVNLISQDMME